MGKQTNKKTDRQTKKSHLQKLNIFCANNYHFKKIVIFYIFTLFFLAFVHQNVADRLVGKQWMTASKIFFDTKVIVTNGTLEFILVSYKL